MITMERLRSPCRIPLLMNNKIIGLLTQIAPENTQITESQLHFLIGFADVIKLSLANITLREH